MTTRVPTQSYTGSIVLRALTPQDCDVLFRWINDRGLVELSAPFRPVSRDEHERWFKSVQETDEIYIRAITEVASGALIGYCQLKDINLDSRSAELQIRIGDREYVGRGIGTQTIMALLQHAFSVLDLHRIHLHVFESNQRACACYIKCGFRVEGTLRDAVRINGAYEKIVLMAVLREDYERGIDRLHNAGYSTTAADWSAFTEDGYRSLLQLAKGHYAFCGYEEALSNNAPHVIWRHDIDMSVHRALRLASMEHEAGVKATYFFMLSSAFYSLHEPDVLARAKAIVTMGHHIGLHFDIGQECARPDEREITEAIRHQRESLEELLQVAVKVVSFHNPELTGLLYRDDVEIDGMLNVYGRTFRERYKYCSDSNGYWRFEALPDLVFAGTHERIHALTHPEWWTPDAMPPRERVERCVLGRASAVMRNYDDCLAKSGRSNIGRT
ncbi:MAG: GNAT family N-acetyltransferase [Woeseiaceae bacterium]